MKTFILLIFLFLSTSSFSQNQPDWNTDVIYNSNKEVIGHIYHTYAIGTRYTTKISKNRTGIRFICPKKELSIPILAIYWEGIKKTEMAFNQSIFIKIDGKIIYQEYKWSQDGELTYITVAEAADLIDKMKSGKTISFEWIDSEKYQRHTMFSLSGFDTKLNDFTINCQSWYK